MKLLTKEIEARLAANGKDPDGDHEPVVKLFTPDAGATWLLHSMDDEDPDILWGLADLGMGYPEYGPVRRSELESIRGPMNLPVERDLYFEARHPLSVYSSAAVSAGRIVEGSTELDEAARALGGDEGSDLPSPSPW